MTLSQNLFRTSISSPVGIIKVTSTPKHIIEICFTKHQVAPVKNPPPCLKLAIQQLHDYFQGTRSSFDFPIELHGTDFQKKVWKALIKVPFGQTTSYGEIAKNIKQPQASRAVGMANNKNRLPIMIPCHRIIGKDGSLTGYAGGLKIKKWLLEHEAKFL